MATTLQTLLWFYQKSLKKKPGKIAEEFVEKLKEKSLLRDGEAILRGSKIEKAGPGFINFYISDEVIQENIKAPTFVNDFLKGQKILLEFTDPNPFKQFHIGHLMSNTIGESISRIFEKNGAEVKRLCYQGDIGLHVAKAIWGIAQQKDFFPADQDSLEDKAKFLGDAYAYGSTQYEEAEEIKNEIQELNKTLFENKNVDVELQTYYAKGRKWSLEYFDKMYALLGTNFDKFYLETEVAPIGLEVIEKNKETLFKESEGAIIYDGEKEGLHTRVFVNSKGVPTYETKDLGLLLQKEKDFDYDQSIIITANEQNQYFQVVFSAMSKINSNITNKTTQIGHGMLRLPGGKMGSRTGNVITASELIGKVEGLVEEKIKDRDINSDEKEDIKEVISIGALKYSILKQAIGKDIIYDFDKAISFEGDSGPYLQYAFTRCKSILEKTENREQRTESWKTTDLERLLIQYKDVLEQALEDLAPQLIVTYLTKLASEFNSFYASEKILDDSDPNSGYKVQITKAVQDTLKEGLDVLGIDVPERM